MRVPDRRQTQSFAIKQLLLHSKPTSVQATLNNDRYRAKSVKSLRVKNTEMAGSWQCKVFRARKRYKVDNSGKQNDILRQQLVVRVLAWNSALQNQHWILVRLSPIQPQRIKQTAEGLRRVKQAHFRFCAWKGEKITRNNRLCLGNQCDKQFGRRNRVRTRHEDNIKAERWIQYRNLLSRGPAKHVRINALANLQLSLVSISHPVEFFCNISHWKR